MKKLFLQALILAATTTLIWVGFSQIDYLKQFDIKNTSRTLEDELGDMLWKSIRKTERVVYKDSVCKPVEEIFIKITDANGIDHEKINLHIIEKGEINAFAMPGNHLVIYTGLIRDCKNPEQLAGVIGHELAHLEKGHIMKKLAKEIGFSVLVSMTSGSEAAGEVLSSLTSSAYDRSLETEADLTAVDYLLEAKINPAPLADFMYSMSGGSPSALYWISTHPDPEDRANEILNMLKKQKTSYEPVLENSKWQNLKKALP